jgi:MYXO-CTERM domain-containing protein
MAADTVTIEYSIVYSGDEKPMGDNPWLTATFTDTQGDSAEAVLLTLNAAGLRNGEFVSALFFNFRESIDPGSVRISEVSRENFLGRADFRLDGQDEQNAGGGFRFDLGVDLPSTRQDRLGAGGVYSVLLERQGGLRIYDLLVETLSEDKDESISVAHVQSLAQGGSAWISAGTTFSVESGSGGAAVPESSTWAAGAVVAGLVAFPLWRRRRHCSPRV